jgi:nitrogen-specific signal transduction histidine kinase
VLILGMAAYGGVRRESEMRTMDALRTLVTDFVAEERRLLAVKETAAVASGRWVAFIVVAIFDPFVRVNTKLARTIEGTGLGLAISRDLALGMSGDLTCESQVAVGSTFTLYLPVAGDARNIE